MNDELLHIFRVPPPVVNHFKLGLNEGADRRSQHMPEPAPDCKAWFKVNWNLSKQASHVGCSLFEWSESLNIVFVFKFCNKRFRLHESFLCAGGLVGQDACTVSSLIFFSWTYSLIFYSLVHSLIFCRG